MSTNKLVEFYDELEDIESTNPGGARTTKKRQSKRQDMDARLFVRAQEHSQALKFTYHAARFEEAWLLDALMELADQLWISDVLRKAKAGKEASVYLCKPGPAARESQFVAAKVYRPLAMFTVTFRRTTFCIGRARSS